MERRFASRGFELFEKLLKKAFNIVEASKSNWSSDENFDILYDFLKLPNSQNLEKAFKNFKTHTEDQKSFQKNYWDQKSFFQAWKALN